MVIGVTGGIGSGKSTVVKLFSGYDNVAVYLADDRAKKLMNTSKEIRRKIVEEFSEKAYINDVLNRSFIAEIVFNDKQRLACLNAIVHPEVHKDLQNFIKQQPNKAYVLYENAILFENGSDVICDKVITVTAPESVRVKRVVERDNTTEEAVIKRITNQWNDDKKKLQSNYLIENINLATTKSSIENIHKKLTKRYS